LETTQANDLRESIRSEAIESIGFLDAVLVALPSTEASTLALAEVLVDPANVREKLAGLADRVEQHEPETAA
jgi:hypothetical protein